LEPILQQAWVPATAARVGLEPVRWEGQMGAQTRQRARQEPAQVMPGLALVAWVCPASARVQELQQALVRLVCQRGGQTGP
jgi:hypothetical protein